MSDEKSTYPLGTQLEYFIDSHCAATIDTIQKDAYDTKFIGSNSEVLNFGFDNKSIWLRFKIHNTSNKNKKWILEIDHPVIDIIELYEIKDGSYIKKNNGESVSTKMRDINYVNPCFNIELGSNETKTFYIHYSDEAHIVFPLYLHKPSKFYSKSFSMVYFIGAIIGIIFIMFLYNLFLSISIKELSYLYYALYLFFVCIWILFNNGIPQMLLSEHLGIWLLNRLFFFFALFAFFWLLLFSKQFLDIKKISKSFSKVFIFFTSLFIFSIILIFLGPYIFSVMVSISLMFIGIVILLTNSVIGLVKGFSNVKYYIFSFIGFFVILLIYILKSYGIISSSLLIENSIEFGITVHLIFLSFGLGDRFNKEKKLKIEAQNKAFRIQKEATEFLEDKVKERTIKLAESNKKLTESDQIKTNFFANISHELRTPLTMILTPIQSALQGELEKELNESFLQNIHRNTLKLLTLVNNLLDFSKIEAGHMGMAVSLTDIEQFVKKYINNLKDSVDSKGLNLNFNTMLSAPQELYIDHLKMDKVIMNLLSNALKFTEEGRSVDVTLKELHNDIIIEFKDNGVGIPAHMLESIFDRFSQVDTSATRKYEGTGIGLALVKEFIQLHGGSVTVESKYHEDYPEDHGSIFTIKIPKGKSYLENKRDVIFVENSDVFTSFLDLDSSSFNNFKAELDSKNNTVTDTDTLTDSKSQSKLLVVEDNVDMREYLSHLLSKHYNVLTASNGQQGIDIIRKIHPDLIITDVMMPVKDGYTMTKEIKEDATLRHIPVLMLTAKAELVHKLEGLEYGADDYVSKPFNSKELLARIKSLLKSSQNERDLAIRNNEIEKELMIARLIQNKLLPENLTEVPGFSSYGVCIPYDKVGGDFYDYKVNKNGICLFIADSSGHGLASSYLSLIARIALDGSETVFETNEVLNTINKYIFKSSVNMNYVTSFYTIIDINTKSLRFSSAGHLTQIIYRSKSDEFIELNSDSSPLGWFDNLNIHEQYVDLQSGDRLVLFTDGVIETPAQNDELFGYDKFKQCMKNNMKLSPQEFSDELLNELKDFSNLDKFEDDLTLLVVDVL